jgi:catechol 2,3-dioxygenase-like lactoylglutathione lyase family enzyme
VRQSQPQGSRLCGNQVNCLSAGLASGWPDRQNQGVSVQLNHTIVSCRDQAKSAEFLSDILGLPAPSRVGHFHVVEADNGVSLDFSETSGDVTSQHYAFLVGEQEFDAAFGRIQERGLTYWADPGRTRAGTINTRDGGRGLYFEDPDGHLLEILTRPYGSGS